MWLCSRLQCVWSLWRSQHLLKLTSNTHTCMQNNSMHETEWMWVLQPQLCMFTPVWLTCKLLHLIFVWFTESFIPGNGGRELTHWVWCLQQWIMGGLQQLGGLVERVILKNALIRLNKNNYFTNFIYQTLLMLKAQSTSNGSEHTHVYWSHVTNKENVC